MENIEVHLDINAQVVIPEWLRAKMGLTKDIEDDDAEDEPCCCCDNTDEDGDDTEAKAEDEAINKFLHALGYRFVVIDGDHIRFSK